MPPRDQQLPEGTDKVINGAAEIGDSSRGSTGSGSGASTGRGAGGGFVASGGGNDTGAESARGGAGADKIVSQVREQVFALRDQASDRARQFAEGGKERTSGLLEDVAEVINDAARSIDEKLGGQYGEYAHRAAGTVSSLAEDLRARSIEDLIDDGRSMVRKSPGIAIGAAAILGFALVRIIKTGLDDVRGGEGGSGSKSATRSGTGSRRSGGAGGAGA